MSKKKKLLQHTQAVATQLKKNVCLLKVIVYYSHWLVVNPGFPKNNGHNYLLAPLIKITILGKNLTGTKMNFLNNCINTNVKFTVVPCP